MSPPDVSPVLRNPVDGPVIAEVVPRRGTLQLARSRIEGRPLRVHPADREDLDRVDDVTDVLALVGVHLAKDLDSLITRERREPGSRTDRLREGVQERRHEVGRSLHRALRLLDDVALDADLLRP